MNKNICNWKRDIFYRTLKYKIFVIVFGSIALIVSDFAQQVKEKDN